MIYASLHRMHSNKEVTLLAQQRARAEAEMFAWVDAYDYLQGIVQQWIAVTDWTRCQVQCHCSLCLCLYRDKVGQCPKCFEKYGHRCRDQAERKAKKDTAWTLPIKSPSREHRRNLCLSFMMHPKDPVRAIREEMFGV